MRRFLRIILFLILLLAAAVAGYFFFGPEADKRSPWEFVAEDFIYAVESDRPIEDWRDLSQTEIWQYLKTNEFFADIEADADYADSLLSANDRLLKFVDLGDMVISAHLTPKEEEDYDFVVLVDLVGNARLVNKFKDWAMPLMNKMGYKVNKDSYYSYIVYDLYDPKEDLSMYMAAVDNVLMVSYTKSLIEKAIAQSEGSDIREEPAFKKVKAKTDPGELYNLYVNYATVNKMMAAFTSDMPEMLRELDQTLTFSGIDLSLDDDLATLKGYALQNDSFPSYLRVFKDVGQGKIRAAHILPDNTAMYTSIGFDDFADFYNRFMGYNQLSDPKGYESMQKSLRQTQRLLKIDFERDFFAWMNEEIVSAVIPADQKGLAYSYYAMLHFEDEDQTQERMNYVLEKIRKRTPLKFESVYYRGFEIKYLELNSFFKIFFKKLFSEIEKPHFTYIGDYVVFSNDTTSLINLIEKYLNGETLGNDRKYRDFMKNFSSSSNIFNYIQMDYCYGYIYNTMNAEGKRDIRKNRNYLFSFPQIGLQLYPSGGMYKMDLYGEFEKPGS